MKHNKIKILHSEIHKTMTKYCSQEEQKCNYYRLVCCTTTKNLMTNIENSVWFSMFRKILFIITILKS